MRISAGRRWLLPVGAAVCLIALTWAIQAQNTQTFTGVITDSMCPNGDHSHMQMGPNDGECTKACVLEHGATYVLFDGKNAYDLSDQMTPEKFAGQKVTVKGTVDAKTKTIEVASMSAAAK